MPGEREYQLPTDPAQLERFRQQQGIARGMMGVDSESSRGGRTGQDESGRNYWIPEGSETPQYLDDNMVAQDPSKIGAAGGYSRPQAGMYYMARPQNPWTMQDNGQDKPVGQLAFYEDSPDEGFWGGFAPVASVLGSAFIPGLTNALTASFGSTLPCTG